jgi:hypothetical protein
LWKFVRARKVQRTQKLQELSGNLLIRKKAHIKINKKSSELLIYLIRLNTFEKGRNKKVCFCLFWTGVFLSCRK